MACNVNRLLQLSSLPLQENPQMVSCGSSKPGPRARKRGSSRGGSLGDGLYLISAEFSGSRPSAMFHASMESRNHRVMNIAVIGWGSLIWSLRTLQIEPSGHTGGPMLPIEFARESTDGSVRVGSDDRRLMEQMTLPCSA